MDGDSTLTTVIIFGSEYRIKSPENLDYARRVATDVDRRMREVAERHRMTSPLRVAVLALLNMADELHRELERTDNASSVVADRVRELELLMAAAIDAEPVGA